MIKEWNGLLEWLLLRAFIIIHTLTNRLTCIYYNNTLDITQLKYS